MTALAPPFSYYGGKTTLAERIVDLLPSHEHYVEAFAGSLAVLLAKRPSKLETVNDLDGDICAFWRALRERPAELIRVCALTPHAREEYARSVDRHGCGDVERARRVWVKLTQSRAGMLRSSGWRHFQDPAGTSVSMPGYLEAYVQRMAAGADRLRSVSLENRPALDVITDYGRHESVLIYADPPYLRSTKGAGNNYVHDMGSPAEHRELAAALRSCRAAVVLSGYRSALYDELLDGWHRVELSTRTGNAPARQQSRVEVLWSNRPLGADHLFGGNW